MEVLTISATMVKYNGFFKLSDYYNLMYDLFTSMGYDIVETKYKHKVKPDGDEIEIIWDCYKKADDYTRFKITARTLVLGWKKVKAEKGGITVNMDTGDLELRLTSYLETDYMNKWEVSPVLKFLKGIYDRYIYKDTLNTWMAKVAEDMKTVANEVKSFFNMQKIM